jgi:hypothetical protein
MTIDFCFDQIIDPDSKLVRPNLSALPMELDVETFCNLRGSISNQYPNCDYPRLLDYARDEGVDYTVSSVKHAPTGSFYFININYFNTELDYFELLLPDTLKALQQSQINLMFYYCEADLPDRLDQRIKQLCRQYGIAPQQVYVVCHNTRASHLPNWYYFNDDEILYQRTCQEFIKDSAGKWHNNPRPYKTVALVRTHKNWRAVFCAQLYKMQWQQHSLLSYCNKDNDDNQHIIECPYKSDLLRIATRALVPDNTWLSDTEEFLKHVPLLIDDLDNNTRNLYRTFVSKFFDQAYWNVVVETHIDVENHPGVFITEKTWKPIAHYQPFVIQGCAHSLQHLCQMGYQTFGNYIDESYDECENHTLRAHKVLDVCRYLASRSENQLLDLNLAVKSIVDHNRNLFWSSKRDRIQNLFDRLTKDATSAIM